MMAALQYRTDDPLWTAAEAAAATGGTSAGAWSATGVEIDSRQVRAGDLFVALKGERVDGHDFVVEALVRGAAAAMVSRRPTGLASGAPLLTVPETFAGLIALAQGARRRCRARAVALTGSVGKTGTKETLALALAAQPHLHVSQGNLNSYVGMPLSLARMPATTEIGVFELGMNRVGEIRANSELLRPAGAVVLNVEAVHLEFFGSIEAIADAKAEIFAGVDAGGFAVLNRDNAQFDRLATKARSHGVARIFGFGSDPAADFRLLDVDLGPDRTDVVADIAGRRVGYRMPVVGRHWAVNTLAALGTVHVLGLDVADAAHRLADLKTPKGRGARRRIPLAGGGAFILIDDSYNASPVAVAAAMAILGGFTPERGGRRVFVLGDMRELGPTAPALHAELAEHVVANDIDLVFTVGPLSQSLRDALPAARRGPHTAASRDMAPLVAAAVRDGDIVTVKGSLGTHMAPIVAALNALESSGGGS
jgi:UDP-N-acetylmuramoyl-tripeptide--D-alanyl-D-alanine ligase